MQSLMHTLCPCELCNPARPILDAAACLLSLQSAAFLSCGLWDLTIRMRGPYGAGVVASHEQCALSSVLVMHALPGSLAPSSGRLRASHVLRTTTVGSPFVRPAGSRPGAHAAKLRGNACAYVLTLRLCNHSEHWGRPSTHLHLRLQCRGRIFHLQTLQGQGRFSRRLGSAQGSCALYVGDQGAPGGREGHPVEAV